MRDLVSKIRESEGFASFGRATAEQIANAEETLHLSFAEEYKDYLLAFGAASFNGFELTGICSSERLNVVTETKRARERFGDFPQDAYVVEDALVDHALIIQLANGEVYCYGPDDTKEKIANSLEEYIAI